MNIMLDLFTNYWWLLIIGFIVGFVIGDYILDFFKLPSTT